MEHPSFVGVPGALRGGSKSLSGSEGNLAPDTVYSTFIFEVFQRLAVNAFTGRWGWLERRSLRVQV